MNYDQWVTYLRNAIGSCAARTVMDEYGAPMDTGLNYDNANSTDNFVRYFRATTTVLRELKIGSIYWPGLGGKIHAGQNDDWYAMQKLHGTGTNLTLTTPSISGRGRLQYGWGLTPAVTRPPPRRARPRLRRPPRYRPRPHRPPPRHPHLRRRWRRLLGVGVTEFLDWWFRGHGAGDRRFRRYQRLGREHDAARRCQCHQHLERFGQRQCRHGAVHQSQTTTGGSALARSPSSGSRAPAADPV